MVDTVVFVRHGKPHYFKPGQQLTMEGHTQSRLVAQQLVEKNLKPSILLHSPTKRTQETANYIRTAYHHKGIDFPVKWDRRIKEVEKSTEPANVYGMLDAYADFPGALIVVGHCDAISFSTGLLAKTPTELDYGQYVVLQRSPAGEWDIVKKSHPRRPSYSQNPAYYSALQNDSI